MVSKGNSSNDPLASRFVRSLGVLKFRLIGRSFGEVGTGKTFLWLCAPGPIVVQSLDQGLEGVALEEFGKKKIYPIEYDWSPEVTAKAGEEVSDEEQAQLQEAAIELRDKLIEDFLYACKHARTILWDKESDVWELFRYAEFGAPNDAPRNYPKLNQRYRKYINAPKATDVNFGLIQGMKDEWKTVKKSNARGETVEKGAATGNRIESGYGDLDGLVHINLHHRRDGGKFFIDVGKCRGPASTEVQDKTFANLSFAELAQLVFPDSEEKDWE